MPVRAGMPEQGIAGLVDSVQAPRYAVAAGLAVYAARRAAQAGGGGAGSGGTVDKLVAPLKRWLQDFF